jgi:hypothetical protein
VGRYHLDFPPEADLILLITDSSGVFYSHKKDFFTLPRQKSLAVDCRSKGFAKPKDLLKLYCQSEILANFFSLKIAD